MNTITENVFIIFYLVFNSRGAGARTKCTQHVQTHNITTVESKHLTFNMITHTNTLAHLAR